MNRHDPPARPREASLFRSNRSQAVRIPKDLAFPDSVKRVQVIPVDDGILIKPVEVVGPARWSDYLRQGPFADTDFLASRDQGEFETRDALD